MSEKLEVISGEDDAVSISNPKNAGIDEFRHSYLGDELAAEVIKEIVQAGTNWLNFAGVWFDNGVECRVLSPGTTGWRKGKIHLCFKFVPDEEPVDGELINELPQIAPGADSQ